MQSSAMVALRTMTMIVCLVAVPLAAVLGTVLPKVVKSALGPGELRQTAHAADGIAAARHDVQDLSATTEESHETAPLFTAEGDSPMTTEAAALPQVHITGVRTVDATPSENVAVEPPLETAPLWNPSPRTASRTLSGETTTRFVPSPSPQVNRPGNEWHAGEGQPSHDARRRPSRRDDSLRKTVYSPPENDDDQPLGGNSAGPATEEPLAPVERVSNAGALDHGQRRLRELGVTDYRLEAWGGDGSCYRCSCSVPIIPGSRAARHFDAIETAPSLALEAVIKQVEEWRAKHATR